MMRALIRGATLAVLLLVLNSCYVPDKFKAELRMSRYGDYALSFEGDLLYVPLLHDYAENKVPKEEDAARQENVRQDLVRDTAFTDVRVMGHGRFHVKYLGPVRRGKAGGRLGQDELVSIIRRDVHILRIKSNPDNQVVILADSLRPTDAQAMQQQGMTMQGEFRLTTDGNIIKHNATEVRDMGPYKVYVWKIENPLSPMPHAIMIRDIDPERSLRDTQ